MRVQKRDGREVDFDYLKIENAITKAANGRISASRIEGITMVAVDQCKLLERTVSVEEIQDIVEETLMNMGEYKVARDYVRYRYDREKARKGNSTDGKILSLIDNNNEEAKQENSNKDPVINSVQRDYMAGYVSRDLTDRLLLPKDVVEAHNEGIIHFHDSDYYAQRMYNCSLINLKDMLQNGTVISETMIEKPHSFSTACNIATQIVAQVASNQYGGQSISLAHLAPFVDASRQKIREEIEEELTLTGSVCSKTLTDFIVEKRLKKEITKGIQTIQYQVTTLMTTNGQAPFLTVFLYLGEAENEREKHDLAMLIEEVLKQRIQGVKNEQGVWITPAFPKLIYVLDEDNVSDSSDYYYLTELAAKCTAKRMVPDYISAKVMRELKGDVYPCMGCRSFLTPDRFTTIYGNMGRNGTYKPDVHQYYSRFNQGVVTINLPDVACSADGDESTFWKIFDERL